MILRDYQLYEENFTLSLFTGSISSVQSSPLYLSDMSHIGIKLSSIESFGAANVVFYPTDIQGTKIHQVR